MVSKRQKKHKHRSLRNRVKNRKRNKKRLIIRKKIKKNITQLTDVFKYMDIDPLENILENIVLI